ncbi:uncharacterized protein LOC115629542 [Scaptodrosophila lebanonensis]|uniref:Uncharacterized protein LOC115629542 n=1 Tax=Drosophila lebanonensis TaxID=7225 RepID=A0A6J2U1X0_DROLE|nr:uncharacterized protein LOC115629542 [Scaptodrosophila lebanonensis]
MGSSIGTQANLRKIVIASSECENGFEKQTREKGNFFPICSSRFIRNNTIVDGRIAIGQLHRQSTAPTLPLHSPHSPLYPYSYQNKQHIKLSGRYIENRVPELNSKSQHLFSIDKTGSNKSNFNFIQNEVERTSSNIYTCDDVNQISDYKSNIKCDDIISKRLPPTLNAATSATDGVETALNNVRSTNRTVDKLAVTSQSSVGNFLSPYPRIRYQEAITLADLNKVGTVDSGKLLYLTNFSTAQDNQTYYSNERKACKSEQTSPNYFDAMTSKFYFKKNNKSTGCLMNDLSDPWLKKNEPTKIAKYSKTTDSYDPWVKRHLDYFSDASISPKANQCCHKQPRSSTRHETSTANNKKTNNIRPQMHQYVTPFGNEDLSAVDYSLLSAPSSPNFNSALDDMFSTAESKGSDQKTHLYNSTKSASFSPARGKDFINPFEDYRKIYSPIHQLKRNDRVNSVAQVELLNRNFLNVCSTNISTRHSLSSVSNQSKKELHLNIHQLAEEMRQSSLGDNIKFSLSDCNVSNIGNITGGQRQQKNIHLVQETALLQKTKRKNTPDVPTIDMKKNIDRSTHTLKISAPERNPKIYETQTKADTLLETSC